MNLIAVASNCVENELEGSLPTLTSPNDIRDSVRLLAESGGTVCAIDLVDLARRRLFEPNKVAAYETWGLIFRDGDAFLLSDLGRRFARELESEERCFRQILYQVEAYHLTLRRLAELNKEIVTFEEVITIWTELGTDLRTNRNKKTGENCVISFLQLCHAAGLGIAVVGRKGQPTRIRLNQTELSAHIRNVRTQSRFVTRSLQKVTDFSTRTDRVGTKRGHLTKVREGRPFFVFASHRCTDILDAVGKVLLVSNTSSEIQYPNSDEIVPSRQRLDLLRECGAAIFILDESDLVDPHNGSAGGTFIFSLVSAASALFKGLLLVIFKGDTKPEFLSHIRVTNWEVDSPTPEAILEVFRLITEFKEQKGNSVD